MAQRRMFSVQLLDSDDFLSMPMSTQALYMHLALRADDDGFVGNPKRIVRMVSAAEDELKLLLAKRYLIPFESGVCVIRHWRIHNYIQSDRYTPTLYTAEKNLLEVSEGKTYEVPESAEFPACIQNGYILDAQVRLGKGSVDKGSVGKFIENAPDGAAPVKRFTPPTVDEVASYCAERKNGINGQSFVDFYTAKGWFIGKSPMKDWKAAVRTWEQSNGRSAAPAPKKEVPWDYNQ